MAIRSKNQVGITCGKWRRGDYSALKWLMRGSDLGINTSGRLQYGEYLNKRLTESAKNSILFDKYINIKIQFIQG
jgi:hypothetical protein